MQSNFELIKQRAIRAAYHLGVDPAELVEGIQAHTIECTILGDATGSTKATAMTGDTTAAGNGTSGDHLAIEPNTDDVEWLVLGIFNYNSAAETETWGMGDFFSGGQQVPLPEHKNGSSFSQRRVNAQAFSVVNDDGALAAFPYSRLPTAKCRQALGIGFYNIAATSAEQTAVLKVYYVPVRPGTWKAPGPNGICTPCACVK